MKNLYEIVLGKKFFEINERASEITIPRKCPVCNRDVNPLLIGFVDGEKEEIFVLFHCTLPNCKSMFFSKHEISERIESFSTTTIYNKYRKTDIFPVIPLEVVFNNEIAGNFQEFVRIYNQAHSAEVYGLSEVAGMGYRKAVEFLVKDFLINHCKKDRSIIEEKLLGRCISDDIDNQKIKDCAQRAAWLGNDETHYKRKWEEKDVNDLKKIIKMLVNFIENELQYEDIIEDMPKGR